MDFSAKSEKIIGKKKYTSVIYKSYDLIYEKGHNTIASADFGWQQSYEHLIRVISFRSKMKHPGVNTNLKNILYDDNALSNLIVKFNQENKRDLDLATSFESDEKYIRALDIYHQINVRQDPDRPFYRSWCGRSLRNRSD